MRATFPPQLYRRRALVASVFSAVKGKLAARAPGRSLEMQRIQALLCWGWLTTRFGSDLALCDAQNGPHRKLSTEPSNCYIPSRCRDRPLEDDSRSSGFRPALAARPKNTPSTAITRLEDRKS